MLKESGKPDSFLLEYMVSMPYVGRNSFLPHPSGNPVFIWAAGHVFAGIFQNILAIRQNRTQKWAEQRLYLYRYNSLSSLYSYYRWISQRSNYTFFWSHRIDPIHILFSARIHMSFPLSYTRILENVSPYFCNQACSFMYVYYTGLTLQSFQFTQLSKI